MAPRGSSTEALSDALKPLAEQLAKLPAEERERVIAVARAGADTKPKLKTVSPERIRASFAVVRLGGNAVDDVNALYNG